MGFSPKELDNIEYNLKYHSKDVFQPDAEEAWKKILTDFIEIMREIHKQFEDEN